MRTIFKIFVSLCSTVFSFMSLEITNNITFSVCVLNNPFFTNEHCNLLQRVVCNWLKDFFFGMTWFLKNIYIGIIILFCWNEFLGFRYSTYNKSIYKVPIPYIFFCKFLDFIFITAIAFRISSNSTDKILSNIQRFKYYEAW